MSISAKLIAESYKWFKVKAVTQNRTGSVDLWNIYEPDIGQSGIWYSGIAGVKVHHLGKFEITEFIGKEPKDCIYIVEEDVYYEKWNNCLVWVWDYSESCKKLRFFVEYERGSKFPFVTKKINEGNYGHWMHCRPVRRDEVQFVEDEE